MDGLTDGRTDKVNYKVALLLIRSFTVKKNNIGHGINEILSYRQKDLTTLYNSIRQIVGMPRPRPNKCNTLPYILENSKHNS